MAECCTTDGGILVPFRRPATVKTRSDPSVTLVLSGKEPRASTFSEGCPQSKMCFALSTSVKPSPDSRAAVQVENVGMVAIPGKPGQALAALRLMRPFPGPISGDKSLACEYPR